MTKIKDSTLAYLSAIGCTVFVGALGNEAMSLALNAPAALIAWKTGLFLGAAIATGAAIYAGVSLERREHHA